MLKLEMEGTGAFPSGGRSQGLGEVLMEEMEEGEEVFL